MIYQKTIRQLPNGGRNNIINVMKTNIYRILIIIVLLSAANGCRSSRDDVDNANVKVAENISVSGQSADAKVNKTDAPVSGLTGGASVPAKRENLTAADRAAILRAVGFTDYAERSPEFIKWWNESYGTPLKNAGVTFHKLGDDKYLVEIMVDQGANQSTSVYALYKETAGQATAKSLELDSYRRENGKTVKTSEREKVGAPEFDEKTKILTITAAARGTGGCGERMIYIIVGDRAEAIEARYQKCSDDAFPPPEKWEKIPLGKSGDSDDKDEEMSGGNGVILNEEDFQMMSPAHAAVLKRWLRLQINNLRPVREDKNSASSQQYFRQDKPNEDPFYAVGDFNGNGIEDFAVILTGFVPRISPQTKRPLNSLAIFEMSPETSGKSPKTAFFSDQIDGFFIISGKGEKYVAISSYPSDDGFLLVPKGKTYAARPMVDF